LATRTQDSFPQGFTAFDGQVLFAASGAHGTELYMTDGTAQGTRIVADIMPGPNSSSPANFVVVGDLAFFTARTNATGGELYCTDGTSAGTRLVADLAAGTASSTITAMTPFDGRLYFIAGGSLWRTDGTAAGTTNAWPSSGSDPRTVTGSVAVFRDELYFVGNDSASGRELRALDVRGDVRLVIDIGTGASSGNPARLMATDDRLFFSANGGSGTELFVTDGTAGGTRQVADLNPGTAGSTPITLAAFGNRVFFSATTNASSPGTTELFISDGTPGGTTALGATFGQAGPALGSYTAFSGGLVFVASDSTGGTEPWTSDGTVAGTHRLADLRPGTASSSPTSFGRVDGQAFFRASTPNGLDWWVTDGTEAGTRLFGHDYSPAAPAVLSGDRIIAYSSALTGLEPAAIDPATDEITPLGDIQTNLAAVTADQFTRAGQYIYFQANGLLWRTDGTSAGTLCLDVPFSHGKAAPDGRFFFVNTSQLFVTDGTPAGTQQIGNFPGVVSALALVADKVVAVVKIPSGNGDVHLYSTPQAPTTAAPTFLVNFGYQIHEVKLTQELNGKVFFTVKTWEHPSVWHTDGTPTGTAGRTLPNSDYGGSINFIGVTSTAGYFVAGNEFRLFRVVDDINTVSQIMPNFGGGTYGGGYIFNDQLILLANSGLYRSAGATMERYADVPGWPMITYDVALARAAATDDTMYFIASDGTDTGSPDIQYAGLWKTDGTSANMITSVLRADGSKVLLSGVGTPQRLLATSDRLYFDANGELYVSDGTAAGTSVEPDGSTTKYAEQFSITRAALDDAVITYRAGGNYPLMRIAPDVMGSIAGRVFGDDDSDGQLDAVEVVRPGRRVYLDLDDDDQMDPAEPRQFTDAAGQYHFGALPPGTYVVRPEIEAGERLTTAAGDVVLSAGQAATLDFGIGRADAAPPVLAQGRLSFARSPLEVQLRFDEDLAPVHDPGLFTLTHVGTGNVVPLSAGQFSVDNDWNRLEVSLAPGDLVDGEYRLDVATGAVRDVSGNPTASALSVEFFILAADANRDRTVNDVDAAILESHFGQSGRTFSSGDFNFDTTVDAADREILFAQFGKTLLAASGSIGGRAFNDRNANGAFDGGESGVAGRTIYLDVNGNDAHDSGEPTRTSDALGKYIFEALGPGNYAVRQVVPAGSQQTSPADGTGRDVALAAGQNVGGADFGTLSLAPQVTDVFVAGSAWQSSFGDFLANSGVGDATLGYRLDAAAHADELPWVNLNRISVRFSEDVTLASAAALRVVGVNVASYAGAFTYDPVTFTATWQLTSGSFTADKLLLSIDDALVSDASGNALDGEWTNPATSPTPTSGGADSFPSGDGTAGGDFNFRLNVLPGDVNRNGIVQSNDALPIQASLLAVPGSAGYTVFKDVNANGILQANDFLNVQSRLLNALPAGEPVPPAAVKGRSLKTSRSLPPARLFAPTTDTQKAMRLLEVYGEEPATR
jgi:ELWxxDGT repeat protein